MDQIRENNLESFELNQPEGDSIVFKWADLIGIIFFTIFTALFIIIPQLNESIIRVFLGIPFVLFLPGYALISALFPKTQDLEMIPRIALSIGSSISLGIIIGLCLIYTPWGLRLSPILLSLSGTVLILTAIAALRRLQSRSSQNS